MRALVSEHGRSVESILASIEYDVSTREDLWSEVFTIAYCRIEQLTDLTPEQTRQWLIRTARNVTANTARRAVTRRKLTLRLASAAERSGPSAEDTYFDGPGLYDDFASNAVSTAWSRLSDNHREVLELAQQGQDGPAIAKALGITPLAARSRLVRARQAFVNAYAQSEARST